MEYKYGVEYECSGVKPDLPDDVLVAVRSSDHGFESFPERQVGINAWQLTAAFKIVDERYKPDSWHARGELPPVGTECEYAVGTGSLGFDWCFFVGRNHSGSLIIESDNGNILSYHKHQLKFRPLRTDREKFIDAAESVRKAHQWTTEEYLGALFDAGFKAPEATK